MQSQTYTGYLCGNLRDTEFDPKILIKDIDPNTELGRDHAWVGLTSELDKIRPEGHKRPIKITFTATLKPYKKGGTKVQYTFKNITNIQRTD